MTPRTPPAHRLRRFAAFVVSCAVLPSFISDFKAREYAYVGIYLIALLGLNILTGYTGQISLGHGAFMAIGGYTTAILMAGQRAVRRPDLRRAEGRLDAADRRARRGRSSGSRSGFPALRLSGLYLALATFAIAVAMPSTIKRFEEFSGGGQGIQLFGAPGADRRRSRTSRSSGRSLTPNDWLYYLSWSIALVAFAVAWLILRGRTGRAFRAVRDSETAAVSSGVSLARYKTLAFGISAAYAGVAGGLFAHRERVREPGHVPDRALDLPPRRHRRRRSRRSLGARRRCDLHRSSCRSGRRVRISGRSCRTGSSRRRRSRADPAIVYGIVLILLMFVLPNGVSGLFRRIGQLIASRRYSRPK